MNNLDISALSALPLELRLAGLEKIKRDADKQTEIMCTQVRIGLLKELEAKAMRNNPNYIKHKITRPETQALLTNIIQEIALLTNKDYKAISAKDVVNKVWQGIAKNKHPDWLKKVKHINSGYLFNQILNSNFENQLPPNLAITYEKLDPTRVNFHKSLNMISKQIFNEILEVMKTEFLEEEIEALKLQSISDKVTISNLNRDILAGRPLPSKADWKDKAIEMKRQGYSVKDIILTVDKGRTAVSKALNSDEAKALLKKDF
jgi:hypothetical protein